MSTELLAPLAATAWGSGNLFMSRAGEGARDVRRPVLVGFGTLLLGALIFLSVQRPHFNAPALYWGGAAGLAQGIGWLAFVRGLALGAVTRVAPLAAVTTTTCLYLVGVGTGDKVGPVSLAGAVLAICAVALLCRSKDVDGGDKRPVGLAYALMAGAMFTFQSLALRQAGSGASSYVVVGAGIGVVSVVAVTFIRHPRSQPGASVSARPAVVGGLLLLAGDVSYLYALANGPLTTASVIGQLHPLVTVVLALVLFDKKLTVPVAVGGALAVAAGALTAIS